MTATQRDFVRHLAETALRFKALALMVAVMLMLPTGPVLAQALTISNVQVDVTAETASAAREQALVEVQRTAVMRAIQEVSSGDPSGVNLSASQIGRLILDLETVSEQTGAGRYIGTYNVRIDGQALSRLLGQSNINIVQAAPGPVIVVPLLVDGGGGAQLWQPSNGWLQAWTALGRADGILPIQAPLGDIEDVRDVAPNDVLQHNEGAMLSFAERYRAYGALAVTATARGGTTELPAELAIQIERYGPDGLAREFDFSVESVSGEPITDLYARARDVVISAVQEDWREGGGRSAARAPEPISVVARPSSLFEWIDIRDRLTGLRGIREVRLDGLGPGQARMVLVVGGGVDRLRSIASGAGLFLSSAPVGLDDNTRPTTTGFDPANAYELVLSR